MPNFQDDLSESITNPGLIAKMVGALMGNWSPSVGGFYLKPGPAISGIGDALLSARDLTEQRQAESELSKASGYQAPQPPGATPAATVAQQTLTPATDKAAALAMPPGASKDEFYRKSMSPALVRGAGKNRYLLLQMEQLAEAQDKTAKEYAAYQSMLPWAKANFGDQGEAIARARAQSGQMLDATNAAIPLEQVAATRGIGQKNLLEVQDQQGLRKEMSSMNINPSNSDDAPRIRDLLQKYRAVNPASIFGSDVVAYQRYIANDLKQMATEAREEKGVDAFPKVEYRDGKLHTTIEYKDAKVGLAQVRKAGQDALEAINQLVKAKLLPPEVAAVEASNWNIAIQTGDEQAMRIAMSGATANATAVIMSNRDKDSRLDSAKASAISLISREYDKVAERLKRSEYKVVSDSLRKGLPTIPDDEASMRKDLELHRGLVKAWIAAGNAGSTAQVGAAYSAMAPSLQSILDLPPGLQAPNLSGMKSFTRDMLPVLIKQGKLDPRSPDYAAKEQQYRLDSLRKGLAP